jgi:hypothetical protein
VEEACSRLIHAVARVYGAVTESQGRPFVDPDGSAMSAAAFLQVARAIIGDRESADMLIAWAKAKAGILTLSEECERCGWARSTVEGRRQATCEKLAKGLASMYSPQSSPDLTSVKGTPDKAVS